MHTLLIVDDEWQTRKGLRELVCWSKLGIEVVGDAGDGQEALTLVQELKPDILLTDVKMPHMDGIELSRQARNLLPQIAIVFLSVYSDAAYLRSALRLDAVDYLYKPIHMDELKKTMTSLVKRLDQAEQDKAQQEHIRSLLETSRPLLIERFLYGWFSGILDDEQTIKAKMELLGLSFPANEGIVGVAFQPLWSALPDDGTVESSQILLEKILHRELHDILLCLEDTGAVGLMAVAEQSTVLAENALCAAAAAIREELHMDILIGLSNWHASWLDAQQAVREARRAVDMQAFAPDRNVLCYENDEPPTKPAFHLLEGDVFEQLLFAGNADTLVAHIDEEIANHKGDAQFSRKLLMTIALRADIALQSHGVTSLLDSLSFCRRAAGYIPVLTLKNILETKLREVVFSLNSRTCISAVTEQVIQIIRTRFGESLSIGDIAKEVHYSQSRLGALFKEETGSTMSSFLLQTRLDAAMTLLRTTLEPVSAISRQTGYPDTQYFSRVFRQFTGCTPLEYRRKARSC